MRILFPNLLFESRLAGTRIRRTSELMRTVNDLSSLMGLLGEPGDIVIVRPDAIPQDLPVVLDGIRFAADDELDDTLSFSESASQQFIPWAQDSIARDLASRSLSNCPLAPIDAVRLVNSRRFQQTFDIVDPPSVRLPCEQSVGRFCESTDDVQRAIHAIRDAGLTNWIAKAAFSNAGRNRIRGESADFHDRQRRWLEKNVHQFGGVYLEPWLEVERECGLQFDISGNATHVMPQFQFIGQAELFDDGRGGYGGSLVATQLDPIWNPAIEQGLMICAAAASAGYFGPLGIDCMIVRLPDGQTSLRLCHDINGRLTMGRLALSLRSRLQTEEWGLWLHSSESDNVIPWESVFSSSDVADFVRIERTSPRTIGNRPVRN